MVLLKIKGHDVHLVHAKDSYNRRALQTGNNIIKLLGTIGVKEDSINISQEVLAMKKATAFVSWYLDGRHLYYSYSLAGKFVDNLTVILKVLEIEVNLLLEGKRTLEDFVAEFKEEHDIAEQRINARKTLGLAEDETDTGIIDKAYKDLAKEHHPDKESGDTAKFKEINHAHKMLKRELR